MGLRRPLCQVAKGQKWISWEPIASSPVGEIQFSRYDENLTSIVCNSWGYWKWLLLPDTSASALIFLLLENPAHSFVCRLETLDLLWMWAVVSVWKGVCGTEGEEFGPCLLWVQVPKSLSPVYPYMFLGKSCGTPCIVMGSWLMVKVLWFWVTSRDLVDGVEEPCNF